MTPNQFDRQVTEGYNEPAASQPPRMPCPSQLIGADVQVWHNRKATSRTPIAEWNLKVTTWVGDQIDDRVGRDWYLACRDPRRMRARIRSDWTRGLICETEAGRLLEAAELPPGTLMALVTSRSSLARGVRGYLPAAGQYAILRLDAAGEMPVALDLHLDSGDALTIDHFIATEQVKRSVLPVKARAAGWVAYHGDARIQSRRERAALAAHQRRAAASAHYSPISELGRLCEAMVVQAMGEIGVVEALGRHQAMMEECAEVVGDIICRLDAIEARLSAPV